MAKSDDFLDYEEDFLSQGENRQNRKDRRISRAKDRSKFKKSDQDQRKKNLKAEEPPLGAHLKRGRVLNISPDAIHVLSENEPFICTLKGTLKKERTRHKNLIAVGDWVHFEKKSVDCGVISHVEKRTSFLARAENLSRRKKQLIAVNIDQVFIVQSLCAPPFKPLLIDRYVIAARKGEMEPIIIINKTDLLKNPPRELSAGEVEEEKRLLDDFVAAYKPLNIPILLVSVATGENLDQLKSMMEGKTSVFSGQSGVGKSSLINAILQTEIPTADIVSKTRKGAHTTSAAQLISLPAEGFCIDTPGIKSFGMWDLTPQEVMANFQDFHELSARCKFPNCTHLHEPSCAIKEAIEDETLHPLRYASYTTLMTEEAPKDWE